MKDYKKLADQFLEKNKPFGFSPVNEYVLAGSLIREFASFLSQQDTEPPVEIEELKLTVMSKYTKPTQAATVKSVLEAINKLENKSNEHTQAINRLNKK